MDLCNREIISYGISKSLSAENIMKALNKAIDITSDCVNIGERFILIKDGLTR